MKKKILSISLLCMMALGAYAQQAAIPTIIVFPSDSWMDQRGYMKKIDVDGKTEDIPDYDEALKANDLLMAIGAVNLVLKDRQFDTKDLAALQKKFKSERAMELASAADGEGTEKGAVDELLQQANPDIRVDLHYAVAGTGGPRKNISFQLQAIDAYTSEPVATCQGIIEDTMDPLDLALRKLVAGKCDEFCAKLIEYFQDLRDNGRKIVVTFEAASGSGIDFINDEVGDDGDTYADFLYSWVRKHAVNKAVKKGRQTKNKVEFDIVRIPFFNEEGDPIEAYDWAKKIRKAFREETGRKLTNKQGNGLGKVNFILGAAD